MGIQSSKPVISDAPTVDLSRRQRGLTHAEITALASALKQNQIQFLDVSDSQVDAQIVKLISTAIQSNSALLSLSINDNLIHSEGAKSISETLKTNKTLKILNLSSNDIGDAGIEFLAESLQSNTSLKSLDVSQNNIGTAGAAKLFKAMSNRNIPESLYISSNDLGDLNGIWRDLNGTCLTELDLSSCKIRDSDVQEIAGFLKLTQTLKFMNLTSNMIGIDDLGDAGVADLLKEPGRIGLHELNISGNLLGDQTAVNIANFLKSSNTLQILDAHDNNITLSGLQEITDSLRFNFSMHTLYLFLNQFEFECDDFKKCEAYVSFNSEIRTIDLATAQGWERLVALCEVDTVYQEKLRIFSRNLFRNVTPIERNGDISLHFRKIIGSMILFLESESKLWRAKELSSSKNTFQSVEDDLSEVIFRVAVTGPLKAGKTSLLNSLFNLPLHSSHSPCTAVPTVISMRSSESNASKIENGSKVLRLFWKMLDQEAANHVKNIAASKLQDLSSLDFSVEMSKKRESQYIYEPALYTMDRFSNMSVAISTAFHQKHLSAIKTLTKNYASSTSLIPFVNNLQCIIPSGVDYDIVDCPGLFEANHSGKERAERTMRVLGECQLLLVVISKSDVFRQDVVHFFEEFKQISRSVRFIICLTHCDFLETKDEKDAEEFKETSIQHFSELLNNPKVFFGNNDKVWNDKSFEEKKQSGVLDLKNCLESLLADSHQTLMIKFADLACKALEESTVIWKKRFQRLKFDVEHNLEEIDRNRSQFANITRELQLIAKNLETGSKEKCQEFIELLRKPLECFIDNVLYNSEKDLESKFESYINQVIQNIHSKENIRLEDIRKDLENYNGSHKQPYVAKKLDTGRVAKLALSSLLNASVEVIQVVLKSFCQVASFPFLDSILSLISFDFRLVLQSGAVLGVFFVFIRRNLAKLKSFCDNKSTRS